MLRAGGAVLAPVACALVSCAGLPPAALEADPFPLVVGARWLYEGRAGDERFELEVVARGFETLTVPSGAELRLFVMDETLRRAAEPPSTSPAGYLHEGGYLSRMIALGYDGRQRLRALGQDEPTRLLPLHPRPGDRWTQRHRMFALPDDGRSVRWEGEVVGPRVVAVPAGRFDDAIEVRLHYTDPNLQAAPLLLYLDTYAPGVGLVHSLVLDPAGDERRMVELRLLSYRIPGSSAPEPQPPEGSPARKVPGRFAQATAIDAWC